MAFSDSSDGKETACNVGDLGLTMIEKDPMEKGTGNPLQYSLPVRWIKLEQRIKEIYIGEEVRLSLFMYDIIVYVEDPMESTKKKSFDFMNS